MYIEKRLCVQCEELQEIEFLEQSDVLPDNMVPVKPKCRRCGSMALINPNEVKTG